MILGDIEEEDAVASAVCAHVDAVVVSVEYRLAPEHPYPAPVEDCYAGLVWMARSAAELRFDPDRLAVYGGSAGGGLTIATSMLARDRGGPAIRFQMPIYPMIDDRNETPSSHEITDIGLWDRAGNIEAWEWYLGDGQPDQYAAPTRAADLAGLPPTFIDVGTTTCSWTRTSSSRPGYAGRRPDELHVYPGAYHASEVFAPTAPLSASGSGRAASRLCAAASPDSKCDHERVAPRHAGRCGAVHRPGPPRAGRGQPPRITRGG